ncbi:MAG: hypothetical protein M3406_12340 [Chloroflexota bacterium]|nr:hypothetical protein [Chloroflexota bacterium]
MIATGVLASEVMLLTTGATVGLMASVAAIGLGIGFAWLARAASPDRVRSAAVMLERLLAPLFDDTYTLVLGPRLPIRDAARLDGLLVGPAGIRVLTVRDWEGRYRVRGRSWEFHAGRGRGWIPCRTSPSYEAASLGEGVARWAAQAGVTNVPLRGAVAFPRSRSRVLLEEPEGETVTAENGPWWAASIGRARRLDADIGARFLRAVLDAADAPATAPTATVKARPPA